MNFIHKINQKQEKKVLINPRHKVILEIIKNITKNSTGVEIGVWGADLSTYLLDNNPNISKIYLIDPWKKYQPEEYIDSLNNCSQEQYDNTYQSVKEKLDRSYPRAQILRGEAENFKDNFQENSIDFIYLDANNSYDEVTKNINSWFPKIKKGGMLIGNNFIEDGYYVWTKDNHGNPTCFGEYSVKSAVRVFCKQKNIDYHTPGQNQWYFIKQ